MKNLLPIRYSIITSVSLCICIGALQAQSSFPATGFSLPVGKTIVITYEVDVNANACPTGTVPGGNISNQSNVTGSNFGTKQTDDPDLGGASDPTLTPFSGLSLGNLVYKDNNKNGVYDSGTDAGVNGVLVRLYLDNGDGVLTVADGAAIATATTAGGGLYSFPVCPGDYIIEIAASNFNPGGALYDNGLSAALLSSPVGGAPDPDNDVNNDDNGDPVAGFGVASSAITMGYGTEPTNDGDTDNNTNLSLDFGFKLPITVSINDLTLNEGTGGSTTPFTFTVTRSDNAEAFSLTVNTNNGTATVADNDYAAISGGTISFTAGGSLTATVTVNVNHDNKVEANETFTVDLSGAPTGVVISDASGLGTINNDDAAVVTLSGGISQNEGTSFVFTATLNNPVQGGFSVAYATNNGTATTADNDFTDNDGSLSFTGTAGETQTITVNSTADNKVEVNETFTETLGAITGAPAGVTTAGSPQTGTILNDDAAVVSILADVSQSESTTPQTFSLVMSNPAAASVDVRIRTYDGTATMADNDFVGIFPGFQVFTFPAGTTSLPVSITINNDTKVEDHEQYTLRIDSILPNIGNITLGTRTRLGTILNDDNTTLTLSGGGAANEGNTGTTPRTFTATLSAAVQGGFTVAYNTNDGTATVANNDYTDNDGSLSFTGTAGETKTFTVNVNGDLVVEANETYTGTLGAVTATTVVQAAAIAKTGSPQTATINNDEVDYGDVFDIGAPFYTTLLANNGARHNTVLGYQLGNALDGELDGQPNFTATGDDTDAAGDDEDGVMLPNVLVKGTTANITVTASAPGFLNAWVDFGANFRWDDSGDHVFTDFPLLTGVNNISFAVPAAASSTSGTGARFRFSSVTGLGTEGLAPDGEVEDYWISIVDNTFSIDNPSITEGNAGTSNLIYTVSRSTNDVASSVDYAITGGTATSGVDHVPLASGTLNFTAGGALTQTITVTVNGDLVVEDNETIIITLSNPVNGGIGTNPGTGTITNDDAATLTLSGGIAKNETNAGSVNYTFTATLSAAVQGGFVVPFTTNDGTATITDNDYTDNDGSLSFAGTAGETQTLTVAVNGDVKVELDETFTVALGILTGSSAVQIAAITKAGSPQTGTITNDDAATLSIAANVSQAEAITPQAFSITLSNPVDVAVTVQFATTDGTATTADNDYIGIVTQTVTFPAGTTTSQTVNVTINNDTKVEADEVYNASIGTLAASGRNVNLGTTARTGTLTNDDNAVVTLSGGIAQNEGNSGTTAYVFTATLNNAVQGGFTANYTTNDGTATTANNDYQDNDGSLAFAGTAGEAKTFTVLVNGDLNIEANETFQTTLNSLTGVVNPSAVTIAGSPQTATITNDEQDWGDAPTAAQSGFAGTYPSLAAANGARHALAVGGLKLGTTVDADLDGQPNATASGDGADEDGVTLPAVLVLNTTANITVNASAAGNLNAWVDFNRDGDWNDAGEQVFTNTALIAGNNALSFAVPAGGATGGSFARFRLSTAAGTSVDGFAADGEVEDYAINIVNTQFSINDPSVVEGNAGTTNLGFGVTRTVNANNCSVDYAITGGTATTADGDYQVLAAGTVNFIAGGPLTQTVNVVVNGDLKVELDETVEMTLSNAVNGSILDGSGTGTITNDDAATITISNPTLAEGDGGTTNATFTLTMSNPSDANVVLNFASQDGAATIANNDYQATSGTHTFTPGQVTKQVDVPVVGDCSIEANETFLMRLSALANNGRNVSLSGGGATLDGTASITNDDALPVINCPANLSKNVDPGVCNTNVALTLPTTSSICGSSSLEFRYRTVDASNIPTGPYNAYAPSANNTVLFASGKYEVEWRVTDGSGSSVCSFYLSIVDNQAPGITCPANISVNNNPASACSAVVTYTTPTATDNCGVQSVTLQSGLASGATFPVGLSTNVWKATDVNTNTSTCSFTVTVKDVTPPAITCPANTTVAANAFCSGTVGSYNAVSVSDNCAANPTVTQSPASTTVLTGHNDVRTVTLTANDGNGNTASCSFTVTLKDVTKPTVICKNATVSLNVAGAGNIVIGAVYQSGSDNCGTVNLVSATPNSFTCSNLGPNTVTLTVNDGNGNTNTCTATVTVIDQIAPTILCKPATIFLDANGQANLPASAVNNGSFDNCSILGLAVNPNTFTCAQLGANTVVLTGRDQSLNAGSCTTTVTVVDGIAPVAKCKNLTLNLDQNGNITNLAAQMDNGSSDNCSFTLSTLPNILTCADIGMKVVTLKATDAGGNTATCTAKVLVKDASGPTAKCNNPTIFLNNDGQASLSVAQVNNGSSDNCGISTMSINKNSFNCSEIGGAQLVVLSVSDVNGNTSSCFASVTVKDAIAPTAICEDVTVQLGLNGKVTVFGADLAVNSFDNCSVWSYSPIAKVYTTANLGDNNLTITVKDWSGNAATCVSVVTVEPHVNLGNNEDRDADALPAAFAFNVYPNPTSGEVSVAFELPLEQQVRIRVFDLQGRLVLDREELGTEGDNTLQMHLGAFAPGVYILDFQSEGLKAQRRLIVQE